MSESLGLILLCALSYFLANRMQNKYPQLEISPILYAIVTLFLSFAMTMSYLWYKVSKFTGNAFGKMCSMILGAIVIGLNLLVLLS